MSERPSLMQTGEKGGSELSGDSPALALTRPERCLILMRRRGYSRRSLVAALRTIGIVAGEREVSAVLRARPRSKDLGADRRERLLLAMEELLGA